MAAHLVHENVWFHQSKFEEAENLYHQIQAGVTNTNSSASQSQGSSLADELAQVRQDIQNVLNKPPIKAGSGAGGAGDPSVYQRLDALEKENRELKKITDDLRALILTIQSSIGSGNASAAPTPSSSAAAAPKHDDDEDDDDDDVDLFGSEDEEEAAEAEALRQKRLKEYAEKKSKKPGVIAKSSVMLEVKPWDDETDMKALEKTVRKIEMDGLVWGTGKLVEVGYGIKKLVIMCVIEDEKVSMEDLQDTICSDEDHVQSVDIGAWNKI